MIRLSNRPGISECTVSKRKSDKEKNLVLNYNSVPSSCTVLYRKVGIDVQVFFSAPPAHLSITIFRTTFTIKVQTVPLRRTGIETDAPVHDAHRFGSDMGPTGSICQGGTRSFSQGNLVVQRRQRNRGLGKVHFRFSNQLPGVSKA